MSYFMVDIEADGPIPGDYSMICLGAVVAEPSLSKTFYAEFKPISEQFKEEALAISGFSREKCLTFPDPKQELIRFVSWVKETSKGKPIFISDNNGFDWMFVCWYLNHFLGENVFGYSSWNLNCIYKGLVKTGFESFKHLRDTAHTHHPVDDAKGNAEALLKMVSEYGFKIKLK